MKARRFLSILLIAFNAIGLEAQINFDTRCGTDYETGLWIVKQSEKYGIVDSKNTVIVPLIYDDIDCFYQNEKAEKIKRNDKYALIGSSGKLLTTFKYVLIGPWFEGLAFYEDELGQCGYLDMDGNEVIRGYESVGDFCEGIAAVKKNGKVGFIDKYNNVKIPFEYDTHCKWGNIYLSYYCRGGAIPVSKNGKWGLLDINGKKLTEFKYEAFGLGMEEYGGFNTRIDYLSPTIYIDNNGNEYKSSEQLNYSQKQIVENNMYLQYEIGWRYSNYDNPDYVRALDLLTKSATQGYAKAQIELGKMYFYGKGCNADYNKAFLLIKGAIDHKGYDGEAQWILGYMYEKGLGTTINIDRAKHCYIESADLNYKYAKDRLALLNNIEPQPKPTNIFATITWLEIKDKTTQKEYVLKLGINSDSKIEDVSITVNGFQDRGVKTVNSSDYDLTINRTLTLNEGANVIKVSVRNAAGTVQEEKTIAYRPHGGELPSIEWLDFAATANKKEYQMKLGIKSKSKVEEMNVTVNGALTRGIKTVASCGYDLMVDRTLSLSEGLNRIVVSVRNGDGISTSEKVITYQGNNPTPVFNDKRIAFVIGNSHYSNSEMNLANPENDAKDVAEKLKGLGFEVVLKLDTTLEDMDRELTSFGQKAKEYDVAMFYYAGHGIQSKGVNYLIPTNIDNLAEDNMKYKCVDMERVLDLMEDSKCKLKIVILDACRNNPLSRRWHRSAGTRGLSLMNAPIGTIISFSTAPGSTALDGKGRNSPYTEAFLNTLDMPNLDVFHFFQKVGASVLDKTKRSQNPWLSVSFTGDFYFNKQ